MKLESIKRPGTESKKLFIEAIVNLYLITYTKITSLRISLRISTFSLGYYHANIKVATLPIFEASIRFYEALTLSVRRFCIFLKGKEKWFYFFSE